MPPPRGTFNPAEGPGDYTTTSIVHSDTYAAINSALADLSGNAVFITGASKGLGRAIAVSFAKAGATQIALCARSDVSETAREIEAAVSKLEKPPPQVLPVKLDVSDRRSVDEAAALVRKEFGHLDIVINNAGTGYYGRIAESDPDEWWKPIEVNFRGPYLIMRAFIPLLLEGGDKTIITVSSVGAHQVVPGFSSYQTSKLAALRLAEHAVAEYGEHGLLAYSIHPGNVPTDMSDQLLAVAPEFKYIFVDTPELCGDSVVYLASRKRDWLAGRYLNVTWDLPELMEKEEEIVEGDKLKVKLVV
ncbi:hypothetical protein F5883DRAFT_431409 [Diaporthe sp. PMI_573]|nr:hypothetical protein F5883DRAFT_431409 [Diaporthaceae sp. PMI_573]